MSHEFIREEFDYAALRNFARKVFYAESLKHEEEEEKAKEYEEEEYEEEEGEGGE